MHRLHLPIHQQTRLELHHRQLALLIIGNNREIDPADFGIGN